MLSRDRLMSFARTTVAGALAILAMYVVTAQMTLDQKQVAVPILLFVAFICGSALEVVKVRRKPAPMPSPETADE